MPLLIRFAVNIQKVSEKKQKIRGLWLRWSDDYEAFRLKFLQLGVNLRIIVLLCAIFRCKGRFYKIFSE